MCVSSCGVVGTGTLGYEDKDMEGNGFVLLMNDDEYRRALCECKIQVFKTRCYYK